MPPRARCGLAMLWLAAALAIPPPAAATTITVTTTDDELNRDGDCSLREAIEAVNTDSAIDACGVGEGADVIDVPVGTYTLAIEGRAEDHNATGDLDIRSDLTLRGAGADKTIIQACAPTPPETTCAGIDRVFHVDPTGGRISADISGVTIQNGQTVVISFVNSAGGAVLLGVANTLGDVVPSGTLVLSDSIVRNSSTPGDGGGIANRGGTLIIDHSTLSHNTGHDGGGLHNFSIGEVMIDASTLRSNSAGSGGGIANFGARVTVLDTTINGNTAATGGGIFAIGSLIMTNSTVSGNTGPGPAFGGGLFFYNSSGGCRPHTLNNNTITNHLSSGIALVAPSGLGECPVSLSNNIIAGNAGPDCYGIFNSQGYNLIQNIFSGVPNSPPVCSFGGNTTGNIIGRAAKLGLLADNGGRSKTHALLAGSPAIDAGNPAPPGSGNGACAATDQRGVSRPLGLACDIGAFESPREFAVSGMLPSTAGNAASTLALIYGSGFTVGATVMLTHEGEPDIVGNPVTVQEEGSVIATTFDLAGKRPGVWDLVVMLPNGARAGRAGAVVLEEADATHVWMDVLAPAAIRTGRAAKFRLLVGNRGEVDAFAVPLVLILPADYAWSLRFPIAWPPVQAGQVPTEWSEVPVDVTPEVVGRRVVFLLLPVVPAGFTGIFEFTLTAPQDGEFVVAYEIGRPYFQQGLDPSVVEVFTAIARDYAEEALDAEVPAERLPAVRAYVTAQLESLVARGQQTWLDSSGTRWEIDSIAHLLIDAAQFAAQNSVPASRLPSAIGGAAAGLPYADCTQIQRQGGVLLPGQSGHGTGDCRYDCRKKKCRKGPAGGSYDPNDKFGSDGAGEARYLSGEEPLRYAIAFENLETATFPAQEVRVADRLDSTRIDLSTFSLGAINFGDHQVIPAPGLRAFTGEVDLRPAQPFAVGIDAGLDPDSGVVTWRFRTIDPATGELPENPELGFLPPNLDPPQGEGSVVFTVKPRGELATGAEIRNQASIVFDDNAPIATPLWRNTIDNDKPASTVLVLPATVPTASFPVRWSGTDNGAGVADYTVYVSEEGGPPAVWQFETSDTSATFVGHVGKRYAFYSVARDHSGNIEDLPGAPDTSTRVVPCPGDCDSNGAVTVDELVTGVTIALGAGLVDRCPMFELDGSETVTVDELVQAVNTALYGCR